MRRAIATAFATRAAELLTPEGGGLEPTKAAEKALTAKKEHPTLSETSASAVTRLSSKPTLL